MSGVRFDLEDRLIRFGVEVCHVADQLPTTPLGQHIVGQVIRSGTSPLANYGEVQGAESRRDFIHKMSICVKELRETRAWLKLMAERTLESRMSNVQWPVHRPLSIGHSEGVLATAYSPTPSRGQYHRR
jgi:four helix bundle protein